MGVAIVLLLNFLFIRKNACCGFSNAAPMLLAKALYPIKLPLVTNVPLSMYWWTWPNRSRFGVRGLLMFQLAIFLLTAIVPPPALAPEKIAWPWWGERR